MLEKAPSKRHHFLTGFCLVLLGAFGFSTKSIIVKLAYEFSIEVDAITLMSLRMLFSLPFFLLASLWHNKKFLAPALTKSQWLQLLVLGLMGYYLASYMDFMGLKFITAGLERVILFIYPTFVVLFSAVIFRQKITAIVAVTLGLSYMGVLLVFIEHLTLVSRGLVMGSALVLGSAIVFAFFIMGSGVMVKTIGSVRFTAYSMTVASFATLLHFAIQHGLTLPSLPDRVYVLALIMAFFSTVLPAFSLNAGILRVGAGNAAIISSAGPILTLILAHWFLKEAITLVQLAGTFLVLIGVYLIGTVKL